MRKPWFKPWGWFGLATLFLCLHSALNFAFPSAAPSISYVLFVLSSFTALAACLWRTLRFVPGVWHQWILFCAGLSLWCLATVMEAHGLIVRHRTSDLASFADFFYFFYGVPVLIAIAASSEAIVVSAFFWFDGIQAATAGYLAYIAIVDVLPFSGTPSNP